MSSRNTPDPGAEQSSSWFVKARNYEEEAKRTTLKSQPVELDSHPLKSILETSQSQSKLSKVASTSEILFDPLSETSSIDPLSKMVADISLKEKKELIRLNEEKSSFEPWSFKKSNILVKYTTVEKLSITSSFLTPMAGMVQEKANNKQSLTTVSDKIKERLEQLDQFDDENMLEMANLSQQEYIKRIDELNNALLKAWNEDDRVKSLKIVIQCSKLLLDSSVIQFYPSKFVLVTDILDTFGKLVYERIYSKSFYMAPGSSKAQPLPEKFTAEIVPALAKETCRNWFFKIASIRELLPRIYIEASILKCTNFLSDNSILVPIKRLINMTAGIGDPLVAAYANCYICRVGVSISSNIREYQIFSLEQMLTVFKKLSTEKFKRLMSNDSNSKKLPFKTYLELYCPAIDWILQCVCFNRSGEYLEKVLTKFSEVSSENSVVNGLLINSMMSSFEPAFVALIAIKLINMIKETDEEYFSKHLLFQKLGMCLVFGESAVLTDKARDKDDKERNKMNLQLLNEVWKIVTKFTEPTEYMSCAEIWIEFTLQHLSKKEINTLVGDIIRHVQPDRIFEKFYPQLQSIVSKILVYVTDFSVLFSMEKFMQFLSLFQKDTVKIEVCKSISYAYLKSPADCNNDIVVTNSMMQICKNMHDYVNALTLEDEKREISNMICRFINRIELIEKDKIELYLNFYSDARSSFSNLDDVIGLLVRKVNTLAVETLRIMDYSHTRKTGPFVRACVAFSFITIPSLNNVMLRLQLYLESAQVAALNQCLSQADAFLKSAISLIPEIHKQIDVQNAATLGGFDSVTNASKFTITTALTVERLLNEYISNMLSTLLLIPDNPEQGVLYLLTGVLNLVNKHYQWENTEIKFNLLANFLVILGAMTQESYIYHINSVESNDTLYGHDIKFLREVRKLVDSVMEDLLELLASFNPQKQSQLALEILNRLISHADLTNEGTMKLAYKLWNLSLKNQQFSKLNEQIRATLRIRSQQRADGYGTLLKKLTV